MSDFHLVDPQGWEYDLQSVYSAYMGYFQLHAVPWHDRMWGQLFESFEQFLAYSWPVITVTDARTGHAHIVTRLSTITGFLKMIKTRFGETLPQVNNMLVVTAVETTQRQLRHVTDGMTYRKVHTTLPAVALAALKARVRAGDPTVIRQLWAQRDKAFLALDFQCINGDVRACGEWGYAAIRSSHLVAAGAWPPVPDANYRKGHYIISEYADKASKQTSTVLWQYAFGKSQVIPRAKLPRIIQSVLSSLASPDSEGIANEVVLVGHGIQVILQYLSDMKIHVPTNVLAVDVAHLERALYAAGERNPMLSRKTGDARKPGSLLSLGALLRSFGMDAGTGALGNTGNDAFVTLVLFQRMADVGSDGKLGVRNGHGNGNGNGHDVAGGKENGYAGGNENGSAAAGLKGGRGNVRRVASVASRLFRPLGSTAPSATSGVDANGSAAPGRTVASGGVDEMGARRGSVLSTTLRLSGDKHSSGRPGSASRPSTSTSASGAAARWSLAPSTVVPDASQRRYSTMGRLL